MFEWLKQLAHALSLRFKSRGRLEAENLMLRQQLNVLMRKLPRRLRLTNSDRWLADHRLYREALMKYLLVGFGNCVKGREDEYHDWYNKRHMDDVLAIPGFVKGQRFEVDNTTLAGDSRSPWQYLALFEIETTDLRGALDTLVARSGTELMPASATVDLKSVATYIYRPITPVVDPKR